MKQFLFSIVVCSVLGIVGCAHEQVAKGPIKGTVQLDGLTPDQQIAKIKADNSIPERYKDLYITSVRAKSGQGGQPAPAGAPGAAQ